MLRSKHFLAAGLSSLMVGCQPEKLGEVHENWAATRVHWQGEDLGYQRFPAEATVRVGCAELVGDVDRELGYLRVQFEDLAADWSAVASPNTPTLNFELDDCDPRFNEKRALDIYYYAHRNDYGLQRGDLVVIPTMHEFWEERGIKPPLASTYVTLLDEDALPEAYSAFIFLNQDRLDDVSWGYFLQVLSHEYGHALGLGHPTEEGHLMSEYAASDAMSLRNLPSDNAEGTGLAVIYEGG